MATNLNQVTLIGNLTRDPELKQAPNGSSVVNFSLALNRSYKQGEEWIEATDFVDVAAWGKTAEQIQERVSKGTRVLVIGRIQSRSWEQEGLKRTKVEVLALDVTIIEKSSPTPPKGKAMDVVLDDIDDKPIDLSQIPF